MLRLEAGTQPFVCGHGLEFVVAPVVGVVVLAVAAVLLVAPVAPREPVAPVVPVGWLLGVVVGVTGFGGATSWRSRPPGQAMPTTMAASSTTPSAIGSTTFSCPGRGG